MLKKLTNTKTIIAIISTIILIQSSIGIELDNEKVMLIIKSICSILVVLGVTNDKGMETTNWDK